MAKKIAIGLMVFLVVIGVGVCFALAKQKIDGNKELREKSLVSGKELRAEEKQASVSEPSPEPSFRESRRESEAVVIDEKINSDEELERSIREMETLASESAEELESLE